ncbi:transcriptional regulator [Sphingobium sp.]|uniref:transcriptional regulator n=1 Tax=Sphingobium sp. TaxID=1912891 RepID=UPI003BB5E312
MAQEPLHSRLRLAVENAGNQSRFAKAVGTSQQLVSYWLKKERPLPGEFVLAAESAGLGSRHYLRPDLYPAVEHDTGSTSPGNSKSSGNADKLTAPQQSEAA